MTIRLSAVILAALITCGHAQAQSLVFSNAVVAGKRVTVCRVEVRRERLQLWLNDPTGKPFKSFAALDRTLQSRGKRLVFGMNAGMFEKDFSPVGLYIVDRRELVALNTNAGTGNFYMKPNGVFLLTDDGARVVESSECPSVRDAVRLATQSGPMLVRAGRIHPGFNASSQSRLIRNGVGVPSPDVAVFAISDDPVNFHEFATLFRDILQCPDALYLDGVISSLHAPDRKRSDSGAELGPILGIAH